MITIGEIVRLRDSILQLREEEETVTSTFSEQLNYTFDWFDSNFTKILSDTFCDFFELPADVKLVSISENTNLLAEREEFFVTQIRLNKELSVFVRLSRNIVKILLENILGPNGKKFNIEKITDLEAKILTGFDDFLYKNFSHLIKTADALPSNNTNYNEVNLTFFIKTKTQTLGKLIIKIPVVAISPQSVSISEEAFGISDFLNSTAEVKLTAGYTKIRLNELKHLEKDDIVMLEHSKSTQMLLTYNDYSTKIKIVPNPAIMIDYENFDENGNNPKGDNEMTSPDIYNMWDTIQVDIGAEFEKVKLTLGELKQISEGLVVDIGSVYDNKIDLKVEDKIVASGELVIINDRYGVKINQIFTAEKDEASQNAQIAQEEIDQDEQQVEQMFEENSQEDNLSNSDENIKEEDFDYSDFDVDEEDI